MAGRARRHRDPRSPRRIAEVLHSPWQFVQVMPDWDIVRRQFVLGPGWQAWHWFFGSSTSAAASFVAWPCIAAERVRSQSLFSVAPIAGSAWQTLHITGLPDSAWESRSVFSFASLSLQNGRHRPLRVGGMAQVASHLGRGRGDIQRLGNSPAPAVFHRNSEHRERSQPPASVKSTTGTPFGDKVIRRGFHRPARPMPLEADARAEFPAIAGRVLPEIRVPLRLRDVQRP